MIIAIDTETALIRDGLPLPPVACLAVARECAQPELYAGADISRAFAEILAGSATIVGHNLAYDLGVLCAASPHFLSRVFARLGSGCYDTMIAERVLAIARGELGDDGAGGFSLAALAKKYFSLDLDKTTWRMGYGHLIDVPLSAWPEGAQQYAKSDAQVTRDIACAQLQLAKNFYEPAVFLRIVAADTRAAFGLQLMSAWGVRTAPAALAAFANEVAAQSAALEPSLIARGVLRANKSRDMTKIRELASSAGVDKVTDTGKVSTSAQTLRESGSATLQELADYVAHQKLLTTYVPLLQRGTQHPINTRYTLPLATGRTSSSPNLQNIPRIKGARECFVPRDGFAYCSVDYDTIELRALADFCVATFGKSEMADAIRDGKDLHLMLGANILGVSYEDALARKKDPDVKNARQMAKAANFGFPGGMGVQRFIDAAKAYGLALTPTQAGNLQRAWFRAWPEMRDFFAHVSVAIDQQDGTILTPKSDLLRGRVSFPQGCNQHFQGPVAFGAKMAVFDAIRAAYTDTTSAFYGSRPVLFIHDEIIAEVPADRAHEAAHALAEIMCAAMRRVITHVPVTASPCLMSHWSKGAEPKYENGRLVLSC